MILIGDIGGTHTRIALYEKGHLYSEKKYLSRNYPGLEAIVQHYLEESNVRVSAASFGIAGAVRNGVCQATNLAWRVDVAPLKRVLGISSIYLLNDLEANGYGILSLPETDFFELQKGDQTQKGNRALISAGTGLGEAGLYWDGKKHHPFACEGGHVDFSPRNELEVELFFYLQARHQHVSYERVVSGPGLFSIYQFLIETGKERVVLEVAEEMKHSDPSLVVSKWGTHQRDKACARALDWFISLYGSEAGNLALKMFSLGGLFVGGSIAPRLLDSFQQGEFLLSFRNKGRFDSLLESIPIWIVMNDHAAILGAGAYAEQIDHGS